MFVFFIITGTESAGIGLRTDQGKGERIVRWISLRWHQRWRYPRRTNSDSGKSKTFNKSNILLFLIN